MFPLNELKIVWSHFQARKTFIILKMVFERRCEGFCLASNEINQLCITFVDFPFFLSSFTCLKSSFLISIVFPPKPSFIYNLFSQRLQELYSQSRSISTISILNFSLITFSILAFVSLCQSSPCACHNLSNWRLLLLLLSSKSLIFTYRFLWSSIKA